MPMKHLFIFLFGCFLAIFSNGCKTDPVTPPPTGPDTTSHDYTWTVETFGDFEGELYDVAFINDSLIYATGAVYMKDSLGQEDPEAYNLMKWNGQKWVMLKIQFLVFEGNPSTGSFPTKAIWAFSADDIVLSSGCQIMRYDGVHQVTPIYIPCAPYTLWADEMHHLYAGGEAGTLAYYNGSQWQSIQSTVTTYIDDVFGVKTSQGQAEVYCAVSDIFNPKEKMILKITNTTHADTIKWLPDIAVNTVWSPNGTTLYAGGSGLFENSSGEWKAIEYGGNSYIRRIRGTGGNNIVIGGDGVLAHYNGSTWKKFLPNLNTSFAGIAVTKDMIVAVGMNMNMKAVIAMGRRIK